MTRLLKEFGKAFFVGSLIFLVLGLIRYFLGDFNYSWEELLVQFLYNQLYSVFLYMANFGFIWYLLKRFGHDLFKQNNLLKAILGSVLVTIATLFVIRIIIVVFIHGSSFIDFFATESLRYYYVSFIISVVVTIIFYAFYFYKYRQESKVKEQKIIAKSASAQFDALKNQLDPHFLFNSLNVLTSLIEENPDATTQFTTAL